MKRVLLILSLLAAGLDLAAQEVWQIAWLQPSPILIGGKALKVGDEFKDNERAQVQWSSDDQVMKVLGKESHRCLVICAKALPGRKGGKLREYIDVSQQLSTRSLAYRESAGKGEAFHFIGFDKNGKTETLIPHEGMFMHNFPEEIWLCYVNTQTGVKRVETRDFRSLVRNLIITDDMVLRMMDTGDEDSYLSLMSQFLNPEFRNIPLTKEEIQIYVTLKY